MEHRTDEEREDPAAGPHEGAAAEEEREPSAEGEGATATAVAEQEGAEDQEGVEEVADQEDGAEDQDTVPEGGNAVVAVDAGTTNGTAPSNGVDHVELYTDSDIEAFRRRWDALLTGFIDDPRASAEQADGLVGELVDRVSQRRQQMHDALERDDDGGETEAMRQAIKRYRAIYRALVRE